MWKKRKKKSVHKLCFRLISYTQFQVFKPIIWGDKAQHDSQLNMMRPGLIVTVVWPKTNSGSNPLISNSASPHLITDTQIFSWAWSPNSGLGTPQTKKLFFQFEMHSMEPRFIFFFFFNLCMGSLNNIFQLWYSFLVTNVGNKENTALSL